MMGTLRLHWDEELGWLLDVPMVLSDSALRYVVETHCVPKQVDRYNSLPAGTDKKEQLRAAIVKLKRLEVRQKVVGPRGDSKGDLCLFSSKTERQKHFSFGKAI